MKKNPEFALDLGLVVFLDCYNFPPGNGSNVCCYEHGTCSVAFEITGSHLSSKIRYKMSLKATKVLQSATPTTNKNGSLKSIKIGIPVQIWSLPEVFLIQSLCIHLCFMTVV